MPELALSILTPAVPERFIALSTLALELEQQIGRCPVEHLILLDNKRRTVGEKRDALLRAARGDYITFVDDDDWIAPDYISSLLTAIGSSESRLQAAGETPHVITFLQQAEVNGRRGLVEFKLGNPNEPFKPNATTRRNAWHVCAWRRTLAILSHFPNSNYGEDWAFAAPLCQMPDLRTIHIPRILHHYRHSAETTLAPPPAAPKRSEGGPPLT